LKVNQVFIIISVVFIILFSKVSYSQMNKVPNLKLYDFEPYHFGFIVAANQMLFSIETVDGFSDRWYSGDELPQKGLPILPDSSRLYGIEAEPTMGFSVGIVGDLRLGNYFNVRVIPSLAFGSRYLNYKIRSVNNEYNIDTISILRQKVNSTYIEFPFLVKYKSKRVHNMRAYVFSGIKYSFDLASQAHKTEKNNYDPKLFRSDTYFVLGTGVDIYMNWFKFGIELNMSYGFRDMLLREGNILTDGIENLRSKIFMFTFTFE